MVTEGPGVGGIYRSYIYKMLLWKTINYYKYSLYFGDWRVANFLQEKSELCNLLR